MEKTEHKQSVLFTVNATKANISRIIKLPTTFQVVQQSLNQSNIVNNNKLFAIFGWLRDKLFVYNWLYWESALEIRFCNKYMLWLQYHSESTCLLQVWFLPMVSPDLEKHIPWLGHQVTVDYYPVHLTSSSTALESSKQKSLWVYIIWNHAHTPCSDIHACVPRLFSLLERWKTTWSFIVRIPKKSQHGKYRWILIDFQN